MQFKAPKGDIRWWSILWLVLGLILVIYGPIQGNFAYAILGSILVAIVALVWLDQRWIAPPMMIFQLLGAVARVVMLFSTGITFAGIVKVATPIYFAYVFWEWYRSEQETVQVEIGLPRSPTSPFDRPPADDHFSNPYRGSHQDER